MSRTDGFKLEEILKLTPMEVSSFLHIAIALAKLVQTVHQGNAIIGDLNPSCVRIQEDLNLAVLAESRELDYAYLSPEQAGRMNRTPDERSDLYALGIMFYEMLAGRLPFQAQSKEEWVHAHLAVMPNPLRELRPEMAGPFEDIIMKLLSKSPEERYQSSYGLLTDLKCCALSLEQRGEIVPFEIARADEASQFRLPRTLFGREAEAEKLHEAFEQTRTGASAFVFISGKAGSGKTALIRELQPSVIRAGGRFISGKCDLMNRDIPFEPILQALRRLIRQIWSASPEKVTKLKVRLAESLSTGAGVIAQLLPEAASLLGDFPAVEPISPAEAAIRFQRLLPIFIKSFSSKDYPLVMFLDDLQWADPATLDVLRTVTHDRNLHGLLVIGAFREEPTPGWTESGETLVAAAQWIEQELSLHKAETPLQVQHIALGPLSYIDVRQFVSQILNENTARIRLLAESIYHRTGGNPLYLHRLLDSLYREKRLYFDKEQAIWTWDADTVAQIPEDPDILHLIGSRIRMLPNETIELLTIAAAIGHRFRLATIALVSDYTLPYTRKLLDSAEEEALICRENDTDDQAEADNGYYAFLHDRVQQAAYQAVPKQEQAALHLKIGRAMRRQGFDQKDESLFDLVYHLNLSSHEMTDETEKRELAAYNLQVGLKSKATTAFATAQHFLEMGLRLAQNDEQRTDSLAYRIMLELPECEYMCGRINRADELLDQLMTLTADLVQRSRIYMIRIAMNAYLKRNQIAVDIGRQALAEFGWKLPMKPSKAAIVKEVVMTRIALYRMRKELPHLPLSRDDRYKALSDLVMAISASVFSLSLELYAVLLSRFVRYGLKHGNNEAFTVVLCIYGSIFVKKLRDYFPGNNVGFRPTETFYTETAYLFSASFESRALQCHLHLYMGLVKQYRNPLKAVEHFGESIRYGLEAGEMTFVGHAMHTHITTHIGDLHTLSERIAYYEEVSQLLLDKDTLQLFHIARQYITELTGSASQMDEISVPMEGKPRNQTQNNQAFYTCTCRIEIAYLSGQYREALKWAELGSNYSYQQAPLQISKQMVYKSLTLAALHAVALPEECRSIRQLLNQQLRSMARDTGFYGQGSSAYLLIAAEWQRTCGNRAAAMQGFEDAIRAARSEGYGVMEAIACERASIYFREAGMTTMADTLMTDACATYSKWGAAAKASKLRETYPEIQLFMTRRQDNRVAVAEETGQGEFVRDMTPSTVDEKELIRQISSWSSTADNKDVMSRFLESVLRYLGAEKGYVLNSHEKGFLIGAQAGSEEDTREAPSYAEAIVRYVVNSGEPVVLANASQSSYAADAYIRRYQPYSVLCMPVLFPEKSQPSVLYLENNLIPGVFTEERLEVLDLMITRMVYLKSLKDSRKQISVPSDSSRSPVDASTKASQSLVDPLTSRETEILYALSDGLSNKEIAYRFGITEATVKSHVFRLYGKLGVKRRGQAIAVARELQFID
ncbi:helix-turn-helix transcriptional regulator [Paenibacillus periandrae]|uniref:helix-turn-helix transcriptional regulator n=1 Tax=Paenibacillus periandrae TaxID=1761741 RepID=UPI001F099BA4|nr:AAA family ATPase [Paenibacillus periandrae]